MNLPDTKKRWRRFLVPGFRLRTLLIVVTIISVFLGYLTHKSREQARAVAWVKDLGGSVTYDRSERYSPWKPEATRKLLGIDFFYDVVEVNLSYTEVTEISHLRVFSNLERLESINTNVSDISPLTSLEKLNSLVLSRTQVDDLTPLASLTHLEFLDLQDTPVRNLSPLSQLVNLRVLFLLNTSELTEEDTEELRQRLPDCEIVTGSFKTDLK